ncbi:hypothetical protein XELAEV_18012411mg [Xenopus laevis]|uniref:Uncharacterized protein n=1 Tax=Xenopus laevis TaxID=8355 RepID=A0A974DPF4_XENLA|nr:hypothetical protein XELAEV_18012411mg [Xenopus laevis]
MKHYIYVEFVSSRYGEWHSKSCSVPTLKMFSMNVAFDLRNRGKCLCRSSLLGHSQNKPRTRNKWKMHKGKIRLIY